MALLLRIAACLMLSSAGMAAELVDPDADAPSRRLPEEVIVSSPLTFKALNNLMREAETRMFDLFNELNDDERYTIRCYRDRRTGTRIAQRVCAPNFARKSSSLNAMAFLADMRGDAAVRVAPVAAEVDLHRPLMQQKFEELARDNPEFLGALVEFYEIKMEVEQRLSGQTSP